MSACVNMLQYHYRCQFPLKRNFIDQLNMLVVFSSAITGIGILPCSYVVNLTSTRNVLLLYIHVSQLQCCSKFEDHKTCCHEYAGMHLYIQLCIYFARVHALIEATDNLAMQCKQSTFLQCRKCY